MGAAKLSELETDKVIYLCALINNDGTLIRNQDYANSGSVVRYRVSQDMVISGHIETATSLSEQWQNILISGENSSNRIVKFSQFNADGITIQSGEKYIYIFTPCKKGSFLDISWNGTKKHIILDLQGTVTDIDNKVIEINNNIDLLKNPYKNEVYRAFTDDEVSKTLLSPINTIEGYIDADGTVRKASGYGNIIVFDCSEYEVLEIITSNQGKTATPIISVSEKNDGSERTKVIVLNKDLNAKGEYITCSHFVYVWVSTFQGSKIYGLIVKEKSLASKIDVDNLSLELDSKLNIDKGGNLFNKNSNRILVDTLLRDNGTTYHQEAWSVTDWIPVEELQTYTSNYTPMNNLIMLLVYNAQREVMQVIKGNGADKFKVTTDADAAFVRFTFLSSFKDQLIFQKGEEANDYIYEYKPLSERNGIKNYWNDKILGLLGDSITQLNNGDEGDNWQLPNQSWAWYIKNNLSLKEIVPRGIGGTVMQHRYSSTPHNEKFNEFGQIATDGVQINYTGMCDWQRIVTQFPTAIKDSIDGIILMGGTNDLMQNIELGNSVEFEEYDGSQTDPNNYDVEWIHSDYYNGGDFKIMTYLGAVCSAIMKLQAWMPKATIIIATPLSGVAGTEDNGKNTTKRWKNINDNTSQDFAKKAIEAANYMSVPVIDINQLCGINPFNRRFFIADGVHPYAITDGEEVRHNNGNVSMARIFIGELSRILPKFDYVEWKD